jgi:multiple sugar transport system ATP-binding protein
MGAEAELILKIGDTPLTIITHGRSNARPGDRIGLRPEAEHAHVFDAASGKRL